MNRFFKKLKEDPRVLDVWHEGADGWWASLHTNFVSDDTETGTLHEDSLETICNQMTWVRLRSKKGQGHEADNMYFHDDSMPYVHAPKRYIDLTAFQTFALADRPEDCIEESLKEEINAKRLPFINIEEFKTEIESAKKLFKMNEKQKQNYAGYIKSRIDVYKLTKHQRFVLTDCLCASTICAQVSHLSESPFPEEQRIYSNAKKTLRLIQKKFAETGLVVDWIPDA